MKTKKTTSMKTETYMNATPFADLMLHPEKLKAALGAARRENDAFDAARKFSRVPVAASPSASPQTIPIQIIPVQIKTRRQERTSTNDPIGNKRKEQL
jgi:hypothetical protein